MSFQLSTTSSLTRRLVAALVGLSLLVGPALAFADSEVTETDPTDLERGATTAVTLTGVALDTVTEVSLSGDNTSVEELTVTETEVTFDAVVADNQLAGVQTLTITFSAGDPLVLEDHLTVVPGSLTITQVQPDELERGSGPTELTITGKNLDVSTSAAFQEGITLTDWTPDPTDPTRATVNATVTDEARSGDYNLTVEDGDLGATLEAALEVTTGAVVFSEISPVEATRGQSPSITITGENLDLVTGADLGSGVTVGELDLTDPTELVFPIDVLETALPIGETRDVVLATAAGDVPKTDAFTVLAGAVELTSVDPAVWTQGSEVEVTIAGRNLDGLSEITAGDDIALTSISVTSPISATATATIGLEAVPGLRELAASATAGSDTLEDGVEITSRIATVSPRNVRRGTTTTVTLGGSGLSAVTDVSLIDPAIELGAPNVAEDTVTFSVTVGEHALAGSRDLTVSLGGDTLVLDSVLVVIAGEIEVFGLTPSEVQRGSSQEVRFHGRNLDAVSELSIAAGISITGFSIEEGDPTRATATIAVSETALQGKFDLETTNDEGVPTYLADALTVEAGALAVTDFTPASAERGQSSTITIEGFNLDLIQSVNLGHAVNVDLMALTDPTTLVVDVSIQQESSPVETARDVTLNTEDDQLILEDQFTVEAGAFQVTRIRPDRLTQGASVEMTIEGRNLDDLSTVDAGEGITTDSVTPISAVSAIVGLTVAADAALGVRDVVVTGTFGSVTVQEAVQVQERSVSPPSVNHPSVTDFGRVEVGTRKRASLLIINEGEQAETVELEIVGGDIGEFRFFNPEGGTLLELNPDKLTLELPAAGELIVRAEYRPSLRATSTAAVDVFIRGERHGGITFRGSGIEGTLHFLPSPPISMALVEEGEPGFKQVSTISDALERVEIEGTEVHVERDNAAFEDGADLTNVFYSEPLPPEEAYLFGVSLLTIETDYPDGAFEGEIWILTDRATAPIVPLSFFITVAPGPDVADDVADADPTADMGPDTAGDAGADPVPDAGIPDAVADSVESDMGPDIADDDSDVGTADPTTPPDEGCCAQVGAEPPTSFAFWMLLLGLVTLRRRARA